MRFKVEIDSNNEGISQPKGLVQVMEEFTSNPQHIAMFGELEMSNGGDIRDINGNKIGSWEFEP